jgi:hypothetical protein
MQVLYNVIQKLIRLSKGEKKDTVMGGWVGKVGRGNVAKVVIKRSGRMWTWTSTARRSREMLTARQGGRHERPRYNPISAYSSPSKPLTYIVPAAAQLLT